ncbi:MAG TPA: DUF2157 domain-containing protein [Mesorhizobium sp.]|jgi:uncharacterized membrane protein|nr:DUF2157 domain-containing protein [Mesorhizobium sp.]
MANYAARVKEDIARWAAAGLVDVAQAERLRADVDAREGAGFSFGGVLAMFAGLFLAAALLLLVAANWDAIPRLLRVAGFFLLIVGFYSGGAVLKDHGRRAFGEALWIAGAGAFGASIALIGQMYHLGGTEAAALITWSLGTGLAALLLNSKPLTIAASGIAAFWLFSHGGDFWDGTAFPDAFPLLAVALWLVSLRTGSRAARELLLLSLLGYVIVLALRGSLVTIGSLLLLGSGALFAVAVLFLRQLDLVLRLGGRILAYCLLGALTGLALLQARYLDDVGAFTVLAALNFAAIAAALVLGGARSAGLRRIAYAGFAVELVAVYVITLGSMLDTVSFFLAAALVLGALSVAILKLERRMADRTLFGGGTA